MHYGFSAGVHGLRISIRVFQEGTASWARQGLGTRTGPKMQSGQGHKFFHLYTGRWASLVAQC